ncbi:zinc-binding dehydrogenase [Arthrobacter russicus]|jgi:putative phosphonate catabolism associated alcohol dehydrogenase|uniref:alcohol dehydrogenase n=1 Tax=Arthrobacter russicus TaxID=172040 RepID=A0ABU1JEM7_9MICC|nr:zinc-binding dehydrogenase [Arthrobacter russicus]MDR6270877.1 putative phosphonate catabolism associated alcohol dehydrogenase [Arthrobacter russicus]
MVDRIRAAVWLGPALGFEIRTLSAPELGPGQTLVRIESACICGSDLHTVEGRRESPAPSVLGHEYCGVVEALGPGPTPRTTLDEAVQVGDRVVWSITDSCGECTRCARGLPQKCRHVAKYGHTAWESWPLSGGFASHVQLRAGTPIALVPDSLPSAVAATATCAGATIMAAVEGATGESALVIGAGMLGLYACAVLAEQGFEVTVWEPQAERRRRALRFGATYTADGPEADRRFDIAVELSGYRPIIPEALAALEIGGILLLAGTVSPGPAVPVDPEAMVRGLSTMQGVHNYRPEHLQQTIDFLAASDKPFAELLSESRPLADIAAAFDAARDGQALRVVLVP